MLRRFFVLTASLFILLIASACSTQQYSHPVTGTLNAPIPDAWALHAKLGIRNGEDSGSVTLHWQQQQDAYRIRVSGPFGQGNAVLTGNNEYITIERPGKAPIFSSDPETLIQDTFGWSLPINQLRYWVVGLRAPTSQASKSLLFDEQYNETGLLTQRQQHGWVLRYSRYKPIVSLDNQLLAHKVRMHQETATLTLIIKEWDFVTSTPLNPHSTDTYSSLVRAQ